jgi:hypothetical protein
VARLRTDQEILRAIYDRYYSEFINFDKEPKSRKAKIYVPIDIPAVALSIGADPELVFGRLHYHLEPLHSRTDGNVKVPFSQVAMPGLEPGKNERHVINFPLLESVLAELEYQHKKFRLPVLVSAISATVAVLALFVTLLATIRNMGVHFP